MGLSAPRAPRGGIRASIGDSADANIPVGDEEASARASIGDSHWQPPPPGAQQALAHAIPGELAPGVCRCCRFMCSSKSQGAHLGMREVRTRTVMSRAWWWRTGNGTTHLTEGRSPPQPQQRRERPPLSPESPLVPFEPSRPPWTPWEIIGVP